jgi:arylsulfatase A-like enzyme/Tfp pilus assembly protein PilF
MARRKNRRGEPAAASTSPAANRRTAALRAAIALALAALVGGAALIVYRQAQRPRRPNLLLLTLDTLRADHLGAYGDKTAETPVLDGLASRGVRFEQVQSAIPLTGPSHATILTGLYPPVHGVRDNVVFALDPGHVTLAERLKQAGYRTGAFVGAYPVGADFGFRQGFDVFKEGFKESSAEGGPQRRANEVADDVIAFIRSREAGPFFAWAHFYDPHAPYDPPAPYKARFAGRAYAGEIAFLDSQLGRVIEALGDSGHGEDTLIAALADHGESLGEHDEVTHAVLIYEATLRVPLILAGADVPRGLTLRSRVGTVDLLPTVLGLLGVPIPEELPGRDLRPLLRGERLTEQPLYAESLHGRLNCRWAALRAMTHAEYKLIEGARSELYNLTEDPGETRNLADIDSQRLERLRGLLRAALGKMAPGGDRVRAAAASPQQEELLRSLGYLGGAGGSGDLDEPGLPDPGTRVALYERLQALQRPRNGSYEQAIAAAASIVSRDPGNPFAYQTLASLSYRAGQLGGAARAYRRALELDPQRPGMRQTFGKLLRELGRLEASEQELRLAVEQTDAADNRTRASLAETLVLRGKLEEARQIVESLVGRAPTDPEVLRARGRWLIASGRLEEASSVMAAAAAVLDADPLAELAEAWLERGEATKAQAAAEAALRMTPGQPWATGLLGHALVLQGRRDAGLDALRRGVKGHPKRPQAWLSLAAGFAAARDEASAEACRRAARALASS